MQTKKKHKYNWTKTMMMTTMAKQEIKKKNEIKEWRKIQNTTVKKTGKHTKKEIYNKQLNG